MSKQLEQFLSHMRDCECGPHDAADVVADDVRRYYRIAGDKPGVKKGSYVLRIDPDGFAVGGCMSMRDGVWHGWHSKSKRGISDEERAEWRAKRDAAKAAQEAVEREARDKAARVSQGMWDAAAVSGVAGHGYVQRKGMTGEGLRVWTDDRGEEWLLVPVMGNGGIVGMQRISADGDKLFVPGSAVGGGYYWLGDPNGAPVVAVGEGVATCDTVRQATGWPVCVAFNAGNLAAVVKRAAATGARVVIVADDDRWTWAAKHRKHRPDTLPPRDAPEWDEWRAAGWLENPGLVKAQQAAARLDGGATVLSPGCGGDWNDLHMSAGLDAVRDEILGVVGVAEPEYVPDYEPDEVGPTWEDVNPLDRIKPLGHDRGVFYFFPRDAGQIMEWSATALAQPANLAAMADWEFWEGLYNHDGKMSPRQIAHLASAELMKQCRARKIYNPDNSRGVGVWRDGGDLVVNTGEELIVVGGGRFEPQDYNGKAVYESGPLLYQLVTPALLNKEASAVRDIAHRFNWRQNIMGDLLAGFAVLAPIGGALKWRPHVVITGEKGAGKTEVVSKFLTPLIGDCGIYLDGGTTEPGMRKEIGLSARPVVMDEGESETKKSKESMEGIFFLARKSSSGSKSATAMGRVNVRSCFCVAAINPRIVQGPDKDRWSTLELIKDQTQGAADRWRALELDMMRTFDGDYGKRLFARTVENLPTLLHNIDVFRFAATRALGGARAGDQIGPLIAGAFSLTSTKKVDEAFAAKWIEGQDWQWRDADADIPEHEKFLATVLTMRLRYDKDGMARESDIASLIGAASRKDGMNWAESVDGLRQIGVKVEGGRVIFANNSPKLASMLRDTVWSEWRRLLSKFEGADNCENKTIRFGKGLSGKATSIPLWHVLDDVAADIVVHEEEVEW